MHIITSTAREYNVPTLDFDYVHVEQVDMVQTTECILGGRKERLATFVRSLLGLKRGKGKPPAWDQRGTLASITLE